MAGEALRLREIRILAKSQDRWIKIDPRDYRPKKPLALSPRDPVAEGA